MSDQDSGQDKTEEPTEKRKKDSREKGQVANSREVASVGVLVAVAGVFVAWTPGLSRRMQDYAHTFFKDAVDNPEAFTGDLPGLMADGIWTVLVLVGPILIAATAVALLLTAGQVGLVWSWKPLEPKLEKLDPIQGLKSKLFSSQALMEWGKSMAKVLIVGVIAYRLALNWSPGLADLAGRDLEGSLTWTAAAMIRLVGFVLLPMIGLAAADLAFQRWHTNEKMKMTREEMKREHKEMDGDPYMKAKRRQRAIQMSQNRLLAEVSEATVVVTNPSHYSVALRYEIGQAGPPILVAAGVDARAALIKDIARTKGIPRVENRPLARALYSEGTVGHPIPAELFEAVAEVLAFVFRVRERNRAAARAGGAVANAATV